MSYMSTTENVGYGGIPQNISETSCATQYKMAVEGVPAVCTDINNFINDSSGDEHSYINENYFQTKFKIDPSELYTFQDTDVIASEITVGHIEDNLIYPEDIIETKNKKSLDPQKDIDHELKNGTINLIKEEVVSNGHYKPPSKSSANKDSNTKVQKVLSTPVQAKELNRTNSSKPLPRKSVSPSRVGGLPSSNTPNNTKNSINPNVKSSTATKNPNETFLDVFKREHGLTGIEPFAVKYEGTLPIPPLVKTTPAPAKKVQSGKTTSASKLKRGRGPTVHEALQRIPNRAIPVLNRPWHAPGDELFDCGPLSECRPHIFRLIDSSSSEDDDTLPNFGERMGCVEEGGAEGRGARLAFRRAALRRQVAQASAALKLTRDHQRHKALATLMRKQLSSQGSSQIPTQTINHLLAMRGMSGVLTAHDKRLLNCTATSQSQHSRCSEQSCPHAPLPLSSSCLSHITRSSQRLFASCSAVFAGGGRCSQPLLPLDSHTPLCSEHAWKRDNYDKLSREVRPRRAPGRRRPAPPPTLNTINNINTVNNINTMTYNHPLSELNVCSNSSAYDSSEEPAVGPLSDNEFIVPGNDLEVEQVTPDDILDSAVLSQIPDEAFTEFFNQAEGGPVLAEGSELARALEAVLDERALDSLTDVLPVAARKIQVSSLGVEMSSSVSS